MNDLEQEAYMSRIYKKDKSLHCIEVENGIVLPRKECEDGPMWGLGGVCDQNGQFISESFYDGGWAKHGGPYEWSQETYRDETVVYVGMFFAHWGHFLVDLTGRLWALQGIDPQVKIVYLGEEEIAGNNLKFFELLGVRPEQLLHITKPTRFRKVIVPQQSFKSCEWYTEEFRDTFDRIVKNALQKSECYEKWKAVENVYFTRRSFGKAVNSEFGEEFIESCFTQNGYTPIAPETLSLEEQIFLWNYAKKIVCINGTIPLNVIFSQNPGLQLLILNKTSIPHENPYILLNIRNIHAEFLNIYKEPVKGYPKSLGEGPYLLIPGTEFFLFCEKQGFKIPMTAQELKRYQRRMTFQYYWTIIGVKRRLKTFVYNHTPEKLLQYRRKLLRNLSRTK